MADVIRTVRTATYKGRSYILMFLGNTKFGHRAQLGFWGPSGTTFWAPANLVQEGQPCDINSQGWKVNKQKAYTPVQTPVQQEPCQVFQEEELAIENRAAQYAQMEDDMPF